MNSGDAPQYALTRAMVEKQTLSIGGYDYIHPDFAVFNGTQYASRNPGVSFLGIPFYIYSLILQPALRPPFLGRAHPGVNPDSPLEAVTYGAFGLVAVAAVLVFYLLSRQLGGSRIAAFAASLIFAFGSLLWAYASSYVREPPVILFLLLATAALFFLHRSPRLASLIAGVSVALAITCDNIAILPGAVLLLYGALQMIGEQRRNFRALRPLAAGFVIGILPLMMYNLSIFQRPFVVYYQYHQSPIIARTDWYFLANPLWSVPVSLFGAGPVPEDAVPYVKDHPDLATAISTTWAMRFEFKGILTQSPVLFLTLPFMFFRMRRDTRYLLLFGAFLAIFLPLAKTSFFYAPNSYDTRYFLPGTAFLFVPLAPLLTEWWQDRDPWWRPARFALVGGLTALSLLNGAEGVLQSFPPHLTGEARGSLSVLSQGASWTTVLVDLFPNYANLPFLIPILALFCAAALRIQRWIERLVANTH